MLNWNLNEKKNYYECTSSNLTHNHPISEQHYKNYSQNRQLNEEEIAFVTPLLQAKGQMRDIIREINNKFKKQTRIMDLHNLKYKLEQSGSKNLNETDKLLNFIKEYTSDNKLYAKTIVNDKNELECLFVHTDYIKSIQKYYRKIEKQSQKKSLIKIERDIKQQLKKKSKVINNTQSTNQITINSTTSILNSSI